MVDKRKRQVQAKNWTFTLNNYTDKDVLLLKGATGANGAKLSGLSFQAEVGDEKTPHLQGHMTFKTKTRPIAFFKKLLGHARMHLEGRKGSIAENQIYCHKTEGRIEGGPTFNYGYPLPLVTVSKDALRPEQRRIAEMFEEPEDPLYGRKVYWFWEVQGSWGKSFLCKYMVDNMGAYVVSGKNKDVLSTIAAVVQKTGGCPPIIIFDVPRVNEGHVSYQAMEGIKNGLFYSGKYEGAMVRFNSPHLLVFANESPDEGKMSSDRWCIENLRDVADPDTIENGRL